MPAVDSGKSIRVGLIRCDPGAINPRVNVKREGAVVARACYGLDPDGISIELFQEFADLVAR